MRPQTLWRDDLIFIEIGITNTELAVSLRHEGYQKYLGVGGNARRIARLQAKCPELTDQLTCSRRRKLVLNNNAEVLVLSGLSALSLWNYRSVRHAEWVAWRCALRLFPLIALLGCLWHMVTKRYSVPQVVTLRTPEGKSRRLFVSRVLRRKCCRSEALHFVPHGLGVEGLFRQFDQHAVRYVVLRWFESLPEIEADEDLDLLVDDRSLADVIKIFDSLPGIQPCDLYSESGLARSAYCGTPYYPYQVARRILDGAVCHNDLCMVPNAWCYFHSLAYHAVYHKGARSGLSRSGTDLPVQDEPEHDYAGILRRMASELGIDVEITWEGLHDYLQKTGWGPSPEMLARLTVVCPRNKWLQTLAQRLPPHVHDQGLAVFVLREAAVQGGFQDQIIRMIERSGFEILTVKTLSPDEVAYAAARTRGGNWEGGGPFDLSGGDPAMAVVAYDHRPVPLSRRQRRGFPLRTNARIFVKEAIRDAVIAQLPPQRGFNALHSSDHAAEAWHMIEIFIPEMMHEIRARLDAVPASAATRSRLCRAA